MSKNIDTKLLRKLLTENKLNAAQCWNTFPFLLDEIDRLNDLIKEHGFKTIAKKLEPIPLTFAEIPINTLFISFPVDGDDSGHGGFRRGSYLFEKTSTNTDPLQDNARCVSASFGPASHIPPGMEVLRILES